MSNDNGGLAAIAMIATLSAALFPGIVALLRGARDNHLAGVCLINLMVIAGWIMTTALGAGLGLAGLPPLAVAMPVGGLIWVLLLAWAFAAPGRNADQLAARRHAELIEAVAKAIRP